MINAYNDINEFETASRRGGYFPGFLIPPIAVIVVGMMIALFTGGFLLENKPYYAQVQGDTVGKGGEYILAGLDLNQPSNHGGNIVVGEMEMAALFTPEIQYWKDWIYKWSSQFGVDPNLIATVMQIESCGDPNA